MRNAYRILVGEREGKSLFGRPRRGSEDNIRIDVREIGLNVVDWIHLAQNGDQLFSGHKIFFFFFFFPGTQCIIA